uniref:cytochrome P450 2C23-like isoform X1 n=1 Tax=Myxine glutinosa TaxID=7769 RepID=UPI00358EFA88
MAEFLPGYGPVPVGTVLLIAGSILMIFLRRLLTKKSNHGIFPPGPRRWPFVGNLLQMDLAAPYNTLQEFAGQYGPVYSVQLGGTTAVVLVGYDVIHEALVGHADEFAARPILALAKDTDVIGGLVFHTGDHQRILRRFSLTTLKNHGMGKFTMDERISEEVSCLIKRLTDMEGSPFEPTFVLSSAVSNVICATVLGKRFEYEDATFLDLLGRINFNVRETGSPAAQLYNAFPIFRLLRQPYEVFSDNIKNVRKYIDKAIDEHRSSLVTTDPQDYIDSFLIQQAKEASNPDSPFTDFQLNTCIANLFAAGSETTATTLRWALLLMMKFMDVQECVQREIDDTLGRDRPPTLSDRHRLPYTVAVINEIQRFGNIVPMNLPHATSTDVHFRGYFLPKGTFIIPLLSSILQDKTQWEKPYEFYPKHFLDNNGCLRKRDAFLPFSLGRRACLGESLARSELFLFFTALLQRFTFKPALGSTLPDLIPCSGLTIGPKPYKLCAVIR